jgi:site-specific DNA recombinase
MNSTSRTSVTPVEQTSKTAVTYLRVSTADQATRGGREEGFSIPAQREANHRKAASMDAAVIAEFVDAGESGTSATKRPELQKMLTYVRENHVDYCIVHKLDRLARSRADDVAIHFALTQAGVTLVSTSENIDETPSGMLMHGIMSSIAEFYSRNLANEVTKGLVQKASLGGTVSRAPLGYKNVHVPDELGRINRTVEIDPERAHLITWAFYRYAEGDATIRTVLDELTDRGLTTRATPKWPSKPLTLVGLHKLLHNPYYKGEVRYRGVSYPGTHEPLIDPQTWQQVQDLLAAHNRAGTHQRTNQHYLRGSVYCGECGSRLMLTTARNKWGTEYPYLICSGRARRSTNCRRQAIHVEVAVELIEDEYRTIALSPELRDTIEELVLADFDKLQEANAEERKQMEQRRAELVAQQQKLLAAHYAEAIPLELLKTEQQRITAQLTRLNDHIGVIDADYDQARSALGDILDLARDCHSAYLQADDKTRRLFNQAFFAKIYIDEDDGTRERRVRVDYNQPFDDLLARQIPAHLHHEIEKVEMGKMAHGRADEVKSSHTSTLVELRGFEPLTPSMRTRCATGLRYSPRRQ